MAYLQHSGFLARSRSRRGSTRRTLDGTVHIVESALTPSLSPLSNNGRSFMSCGSCAVAVCIAVSDTALGTTLSTSCRTVASLYETERLSFGQLVGTVDFAG